MSYSNIPQNLVLNKRKTKNSLLSCSRCAPSCGRGSARSCVGAIAAAHFRIGAVRTAIPRKPCNSRRCTVATAHQRKINRLMMNTINEAGSRNSPQVIKYRYLWLLTPMRTHLLEFKHLDRLFQSVCFMLRFLSFAYVHVCRGFVSVSKKFCFVLSCVITKSLIADVTRVTCFCHHTHHVTLI